MWFVAPPASLWTLVRSSSLIFEDTVSDQNSELYGPIAGISRTIHRSGNLQSALVAPPVELERYNRGCGHRSRSQRRCKKRDSLAPPEKKFHSSLLQKMRSSKIR